MSASVAARRSASASAAAFCRFGIAHGSVGSGQGGQRHVAQRPAAIELRRRGDALAFELDGALQIDFRQLEVGLPIMTSALAWLIVCSARRTWPWRRRFPPAVLPYPFAPRRTLSTKSPSFALSSATRPANLLATATRSTSMRPLVFGDAGRQTVAEVGLPIGIAEACGNDGAGENDRDWAHRLSAVVSERA